MAGSRGGKTTSMDGRGLSLAVEVGRQHPRMDGLIAGSRGWKQHPRMDGFMAGSRGG